MVGEPGALAARKKSSADVMGLFPGRSLQGLWVGYGNPLDVKYLTYLTPFGKRELVYTRYF